MSIEILFDLQIFRNDDLSSSFLIYIRKIENLERI